MIDLSAQLPTRIRTQLSRSSEAMQPPIAADGARWKRLLTERSLPPSTGKLATDDAVQLSRLDVFNLAQSEPTAASAFQLLWYSMAWGLGKRAPRLRQRLDAIARDPDQTGRLLVDAWRSVLNNDPLSDGYRTLITDSGKGKISQLGPAFATKFLYFCQGSERQPQHLILDRRVALKLRDLCVWPGAKTSGWSPESYERYCTLLGQWAVEASRESENGSIFRADDIELALFQKEDKIPR